MGKWRYTLKSGSGLRAAIDAEDTPGVLNALVKAYEELLRAGLIDEADFESYTEDLEGMQDAAWYDEDDDLADSVDWYLDEFYDLCDNIGVWIPID